MDTWEETTNRVKHAVLAEEPEAALAGALELFANFGRVLELISQDMDRIATALEKQDVTISGSPAPIAVIPVADESAPKEHDL